MSDERTGEHIDTSASITAAGRWASTRSYHHTAFSPERLRAERTATISVCVPTRETAETIGGEVGLSEGGGRVTELTARPLLRLFYPELAEVRQPLAGEVAARRELLLRLPFATGYAVETAMLLDAYREVGLGGLAQVDLEQR